MKLYFKLLFTMVLAFLIAFMIIEADNFYSISCKI